MVIVLDTSVVIDFLRRKKPEETWFYKINLEYEEIQLSLITVAELYSGRSAYTRDGMIKLNGLLKGVRIKSPNMEVAKKAGELKMKYKIHIPDAFIAALALDQNLPLATLDSGDFKKIKGLKFYH